MPVYFLGFSHLGSFAPDAVRDGSAAAPSLPCRKQLHCKLMHAGNPHLHINVQAATVSAVRTQHDSGWD